MTFYALNLCVYKPDDWHEHKEELEGDDPKDIAESVADEFNDDLDEGEEISILVAKDPSGSDACGFRFRKRVEAREHAEVEGEVMNYREENNQFQEAVAAAREERRKREEAKLATEAALDDRWQIAKAEAVRELDAFAAAIAPARVGFTYSGGAQTCGTVWPNDLGMFRSNIMSVFYIVMARAPRDEDSDGVRCSSPISQVTWDGSAWRHSHLHEPMSMGQILISATRLVDFAERLELAQTLPVKTITPERRTKRASPWRAAIDVFSWRVAIITTMIVAVALFCLRLYLVGIAPCR